MSRRIEGPASGRSPDVPAYDDGTWVHDRAWAGEARSAVGCAVLMLGLLLVFDVGSGRLTSLRLLLWAALAFVLFTVLLPTRVSACAGTLVCQGLLGQRSVCTDRLVAVSRSDGVAQRLVLRDDFGGRVEFDPRVLVVNPALWRLLDEGARASAADGSLVCGTAELRRLSERLDRETARTVFRISGLE
ncbi:hypothetical protein [Streptomyces sp. NBC_00878]|uniref:hypothetical protein n=1 Tax=Streptomyces sp. NBC_00878 TaxID=2975854 RepID=UPI00224CCD46|nr:hypothetical protein [Streptomyces sp. NBC_00878]MCX4911081.1 hypothetical protein [Streptomyces sp. NBC_00878]